MRILWESEYRHIAVVIWSWAGETQLQQDWALNTTQTAAWRDVSGLLGYIHGVASGKGWEPPVIVYSGVLTREELEAKWEEIKHLRYGRDPMVDAYKYICKGIQSALHKRDFPFQTWQGDVADTQEERLRRMVEELKMLHNELSQWCHEVYRYRHHLTLFWHVCRNVASDIVDFSSGGIRESFQAPFLRLIDILTDPELVNKALCERNWD